MSPSNTPTIEQKISELEKLVAWFDSDEFELEKATGQYEKAQALAVDIEHDIATLKNSIEQVGGDAA